MLRLVPGTALYTCHTWMSGAEYDLTEDLAGIAAGGQIIMGPKTYQRYDMTDVLYIIVPQSTASS